MHIRGADRQTTITRHEAPPRERCPSAVPDLPAYLRDTYYWAYLNPRNVRILDRELVVRTILWGQHHGLRRHAFADIEPGHKVLLPAHVYGDFVTALARHVGRKGRLDVADVAPVQVAKCQEKLKDCPQAMVRRADAAEPGSPDYDRICCYFLLHEMPDGYKRAVVGALLGRVVPGGKVIFMDYHKPHPAHPLKGITSLVFHALEPFAKSLWRNEIADFGGQAAGFTWLKETYFGGLFQKVVAHRAPAGGVLAVDRPHVQTVVGGTMCSGRGLRPRQSAS